MLYCIFLYIVTIICASVVGISNMLNCITFINIYIYIRSLRYYFFSHIFIFMKNHLVHRVHSFIQCVLCSCLNVKNYLNPVVYLVVCLLIYTYIYIDIYIYKYIYLHISTYTKYAEYILFIYWFDYQRKFAR